MNTPLSPEAETQEASLTIDDAIRHHQTEAKKSRKFKVMNYLAASSFGTSIVAPIVYKLENDFSFQAKDVILYAVSGVFASFFVARANSHSSDAKLHEQVAAGLIVQQTLANQQLQVPPVQ